MDRNRPTQCRRLLDYLLLYKRINPLESWEKLGIYRLSARIGDLKKAGHLIHSGRVTVANQFGEECRVAVYELIDEDLTYATGTPIRHA